MYVSCSYDPVRSVNFYLQDDDGYLCSAEFTEISKDALSDMFKCYGIDNYKYLDYGRGIWYFFNRLFTNKNIRNKGWATHIMNMLLAFWVYEYQINIVNYVNPYGDLDLDGLLKFFGKFDFEQITPEVPNLVVRLCNKVDVY